MKLRLLKQGVKQRSLNTLEKHVTIVKAEFALWSKVIEDVCVKE